MWTENPHFRKCLFFKSEAEFLCPKWIVWVCLLIFHILIYFYRQLQKYHLFCTVICQHISLCFVEIFILLEKLGSSCLKYPMYPQKSIYCNLDFSLGYADNLILALSRVHSLVEKSFLK